MAGDEELVPLHDVHSFIKAGASPAWACSPSPGRWRPPGLASATAAPAGGALVWWQRFGACPPRLASSESLVRAGGTFERSLWPWFRCAGRPSWGLPWRSGSCTVSFHLCCFLANLTLARLRLGRALSKAATWLILPVVICLSQRLSHACLSINYFIL